MDLRWCLRSDPPETDSQTGPGAPPLLPHLVLCVLGSTEELRKNVDPALSLLATRVEWPVFSVVFGWVEWQNQKEATSNLTV